MIDSRQSGLSLSLTSTTSTVVVALQETGAVTFGVVGLTGTGATLLVESSIDGTVFGSLTGVSPFTVDGQYRVDSAGYAAVRLRVSVAGTGTATIAYNASGVSGQASSTSAGTSPSSMHVTMTIVTLAAGVSQRLIAANAARKSLQILNIDTGFATLMSYPTTGTYTVVIGSGYPLEAASASGHQGGSSVAYDAAGVSTDEWDGISTVGTRLLVLEGA